MGYIHCKKCGCQMSDKSEACPQCGTPTELAEETIVETIDFPPETVTAITNDDESSKSRVFAIKKKHIFGVAGLMLICAGIAVLVWRVVSFWDINIPDSNFKQYLIDNFDTDGNGRISKQEAEEVYSINCDNRHIQSLKGIEHFKYLRWLDCSGNELTSLNVQDNTCLYALMCTNNQLTELDISKNTKLQALDCYHNRLTQLDVSKNVKLVKLGCVNNNLTNLNVSNNKALTVLACGANPIGNLDVRNNKKLTLLDCSDNQLTQLDISHNTELEELYCAANQLTSLDVSRNTSLILLKCNNNLLTILDISRTKLGRGGSELLHTLNCSQMNTLQTLYLERKYEINGITTNRNTDYIPSQTKIVYVD